MKQDSKPKVHVPPIKLDFLLPNNTQLSAKRPHGKQRYINLNEPEGESVGPQNQSMINLEPSNNQNVPNHVDSQKETVTSFMNDLDLRIEETPITKHHNKSKGSSIIDSLLHAAELNHMGRTNNPQLMEFALSSSKTFKNESSILNIGDKNAHQAMMEEMYEMIRMRLIDLSIILKPRAAESDEEPIEKLNEKVDRER